MFTGRIRWLRACAMVAYEPHKSEAAYCKTYGRHATITTSLIGRLQNSLRTTVRLHRLVIIEFIFIEMRTRSGSPQLQSIDLRRMNLTTIPEAVTQACKLSTVLLDFNYLYGLFCGRNIDETKFYYAQVQSHSHRKSYSSWTH